MAMSGRSEFISCRSSGSRMWRWCLVFGVVRETRCSSPYVTRCRRVSWCCLLSSLNTCSRGVSFVVLGSSELGYWVRFKKGVIPDHVLPIEPFNGVIGRYGDSCRTIMIHRDLAGKHRLKHPPDHAVYVPRHRSVWVHFTGDYRCHLYRVYTDWLYRLRLGCRWC